MTTLTKILKVVFITLGSLLILAALLLVGLSYAAPYIPIKVAELGFWLTRPITKQIVSYTAMDVWIARALALVFYAVIMFSLSAWLKKLSPPHILFSQRGRIILFSLWCVGCIAMSFLSKNVYFSQDGKPLQKYYRHLDGRIEYFPLEMDVNPSNGEPLEFVTVELRKEEELRTLAYRQVTVESSPPNADVYLNWKHIGKTPLTITQPRTEAVLVVALNGYVPQYKDISEVTNQTISLNLRPEEAGAKTFLTLEMRNSTNLDVSASLRSELLKRKLSVAGAIEEREFKKQLETAGGITNEAFLSWARARFGIQYAIFTKANVSAIELGKVDVGYERIQQSVQGMVRNELILDVEILDLTSGRNIATFTSKTHETVDKSMTDISSLLRQACSQIARKISQEVL